MSNQKRKNCRPRRVRRVQHDRQKRAAAARKEHAEQVRRARASIMERLERLERRANMAEMRASHLASWCSNNNKAAIDASSLAWDCEQQAAFIRADLRIQTRLLWLFVVALWLAFVVRELLW